MATFWVSFANDDEFLGVAIVDFDDREFDPDDRRKLVEAVIRKTIEVGANPGDGGVQAQKIPDELPERFKNRLLTKDEVALLNAGGHTN
jgi:hypothetical protein